MERRKLTKEDIDKVRDIEGFPIGSDEDIIALSDAPYYTACPNPFIEEFIRENGTPYDEATDDYHREPFAADVSEGKNDPLYNAHGYHMEPWKQSKEKAEFAACAKSLGYSDIQIGYERGYDASFGSFVRCGAVIILDVDEMVHAQTQGRIGMFHDIKLLAGQNKLSNMVRRFLLDGFDVYISADHGNTACVGVGRVIGSGVEVETKSHKMMVLKDFADKESLVQKYGLTEYPKYYLPKEYDYLICDVGKSLDVKGEAVMTHGGMSLDEVVVPFIKIKAVQNNG